MKKRTIRGYFLAGLFLVVPAYITIYILRLIVGFLGSFTKTFPSWLRPETYFSYSFPGLEIAITIVGIFLLGVIATNFLGRSLVRFSERMIDKIPFLRTVYRGSKQFMETFFSGQRDGFSSVVMLEYPRRGIYCIAFVTSKTKGEMQAITKEPAINLFLPTTPNPTSGFYLVVPESDTTPLKMSVEDAFKVIMTGGMVVPSEDGVVTEEQIELDDVIGPSFWKLY
ncbi:MAG: DUF502 domain-containing protein [Proteobacteria bacterium]|nr:DUF502 domain-containing protein [Pseudomonadota bacterium]